MVFLFLNLLLSLQWLLQMPWKGTQDFILKLGSKLPACSVSSAVGFLHGS